LAPVNPELAQAVGRALGERVVSARSVAGGDINDAWHVGLGSDTELFVKSNASAAPGFFEREAEGLRWLAEARALRVPVVRAVGEAPAFLALEWLEPAPRMPGHDEALGRGLAALHRTGAPTFGLARDNFIGSMPQANAPLECWSEFYAERRLRPLLRRARDAGVLPRALAIRLEAVAQRLPELSGPPEPPARLHGDLWSGNLHRDDAGAPCLVDPAAYGGHREIDLAMLRLFGGAEERAFDAYAEALNLFGAGYLGSLASAVERYA